MTKQFMKRYLPTPDKVRSIQSLHFLGDILHEPNLWHINRHGVARAFLVGVWFAFIPMPFQMLAAAFCAIWLNANLPLSVALVWISNPITMPPLFYFNYKIGAWALHRPVLDFEFHWSLAWIGERVIEIGVPLYLGSLICATVFACTAYLLTQYFWRRRIRISWRMRQQARRQQQGMADHTS